jgi:hypothetical protein
VRNSILGSLVVATALLIVAHVADPAAQGRQRISGEGFVSEGVPKMPNPPGPAPKRDLSGAWVGPQSNKPDPAPPMTPAGQEAFKERRGYGSATQLGRGGGTSGQPGESNDPFITCDPLGFPRNLLAHAISSRGGMLFGSAPNRILIAYEQQRVWREIFTDGRALPKEVDVRGAPESRYYGYSIGHWENDNTLVIETTGVDERAWLDEVGHPLSSSAHITERYTRVDQYNLQLTVTVDDPKYYTKPWTSIRANWYWMKAQEFSESFCVPSEAIQYRDTLAKPSGIKVQ